MCVNIFTEYWALFLMSSKVKMTHLFCVVLYTHSTQPTSSHTGSCFYVEQSVAWPLRHLSLTLKTPQAVSMSSKAKRTHLLCVLLHTHTHVHAHTHTTHTDRQTDRHTHTQITCVCVCVRVCVCVCVCVCVYITFLICEKLDAYAYTHT